jgi:predicted glycoside hydrolase/deacetylase ChbG (UPF0249 family)
VTAAGALVVTADDFGLCEEVDDGVVEAHRAGVVTAASLMVRRGSAASAVQRARRLPGLALGLHLDLGEWVHRDGAWSLVDAVVDPDDHEAARAEVLRQVGRFVELVGRPPTHLDGHQHVHREPHLAPLVARLGDALGVPVRDRTYPYVGGFYGQSGTGEPHPEWITVTALVALLEQLPPGPHELGCHPGRAVPVATSVYAAERERELAALTDPAVRAALARAGRTLVPPSTALGELVDAHR